VVFCALVENPELLRQGIFTYSALNDMNLILFNFAMLCIESVFLASKLHSTIAQDNSSCYCRKMYSDYGDQ
jgi:hypothetical protein